MGKKPRTPPPPRRVQAPRPRTESTDRQRKILYALAISGIVMLLVVLGAFAFVARDDGRTAITDPGAALRAGGCTLRSFPGLGQKHTNNLNAKIKYNSFPPTSGTHYVQPAPWGFYDEPLSQVQVVHNLEHGGVAIQYGSATPASTRGELEGFYRKDPRGLIVAPLPRLGDKIALTAWTVSRGKDNKVVARGRLATCKRFNEGAFDAYLAAYRFKGPESCVQAGQVQCFRPQDLEPGE